MADGDDTGSAGAVLLAYTDVLLGNVSTAENQLLLMSGAFASSAHDVPAAARAVELCWDGKQEPDEGILNLLDFEHRSDFEWGAGGDEKGDVMAERWGSGNTAVHGSTILRVSPGSEPTQKPKRKAKKRYRSELLLLRASVVELERKLNAIKSRQERTESVWRNENEPGSGLHKWLKAARTEMQAMTRARLKNTKLKDSVNTHAKYSKELQKLISQRSAAEEELLEQRSPSQQQQLEIALPRPTAKEIQIYDQLVKSIDARVCDLEAASTVPELTEINSARAIQQQATISDFSIQLNEEQALCIDLVDRYIVPFNFQSVALVLWEYVLSRVLKLTNILTHTEVIKSTSDLIVTKQSANSNLMIKDHQFTTEYSVTKRFLCADRVDFLWESITMSSGSMAQGTPAIQLVQKGWGKIANIETRNGSSATSVLAYTRLTPSTTNDPDFFPSNANEEENQCSHQVQAQEQFDVRKLVTHIVSGYRIYVASVRGYIENSLIDEMLCTAKATQQQRYR